MSFCGIIRPVTIMISMVAMLSILAPEVYATLWPYLAAAAVLIVPALVYRWWDTRYNPGCSVRYRDPIAVEESEA